MNLLQAVTLAIVQGATEFLPVSSKTHLALTSKLLGIGDIPIDFVVTLHLGTLLAVLVYYRKDLWAIATSPFRLNAPVAEGNEPPRDHFRLLGLLILATIPAALAGYKLEDRIEGLLNNVTLDGLGLIATAGLLVAASRMKGTRGLAQTGWKQALAVGCAQACALLPGISRSGSTIFGSLACGMSREWAPRFSFLLSVPIILGGAAVKVKDLLEGGASPLFNPAIYAIAALAAAVVGYLAVVLVIDSVKRGNLIYFAAYCALVGVVAVVTGALGLA
jgi:undecaprenyl-diphosphatase